MKGGLCEVANCDLLARVKILHSDGGTRLLCAAHWLAAQNFTSGAPRTVSVLDLAECFVPDCGEDAVTIVGRYDEDPRPVCRRHLDDLSWIDLPQDVTLDPGTRHG